MMALRRDMSLSHVPRICSTVRRERQIGARDKHAQTTSLADVLRLGELIHVGLEVLTGNTTLRVQLTANGARFS